MVEGRPRHPDRQPGRHDATHSRPGRRGKAICGMAPTSRSGRSLIGQPASTREVQNIVGFRPGRVSAPVRFRFAYTLQTGTM